MIQATSQPQPAVPAENRPVEPSSRLSGGVVPIAVILVIVIAVVMRRRRRGR
ncbi:MAG: hypothetical protein HOQ17_17175 [Gemmatimonadaceae bacterium]|nr:hypothetical protein [Gemmatimonadaceae bacterium]NUO93958.1 hypothetical protein [Gemmatimonadaceae bacterium]NUP54745.1 hypothetical protein [Gemmatimonadaceae bacterium]NUP70035.1 hypothetical protein [Gemmatimonadaceae bacterium]NUR35533.1 hypothetical protein [Gemmatimonadaceae bacterium]